MLCNDVTADVGYIIMALQLPFISQQVPFEPALSLETMRLSDVSNVLAAAGVGVAGQSTIGGLSGSHTDIPRWCGKPYMAG